MSRTYDVAVVGATGAVGRVMISILLQRNFPARTIHALASTASAGKSIEVDGRRFEIGALDDFDFRFAQIALFSAGAAVSKIHAPRAAQQGAVVIDNTSQFRYDDDVPLVVPEINAHAIARCQARGIIANPNCSTIQMLLALHPIHQRVMVKHVHVATYQAVSGSGASAIEELRTQSEAILKGKTPQARVYPQPIGFNVLPQIDVFMDNGYTKEEMKMVWETRKILEQQDIGVDPTAVRVPVFYGHSEALHIETRDKCTAEQARNWLRQAPGIELVDQSQDGIYPTAVTHAAGQDAVYVGRVRESISHPHGLNMWVVADNLRKGAALNSVQIAEKLIQSGTI